MMNADGPLVHAQSLTQVGCFYEQSRRLGTGPYCPLGEWLGKDHAEFAPCM